MAGLLRRRGERRVRFLAPEWWDLFRTVVRGAPGIGGATASFEITIRRNDGAAGIWTLVLEDGAMAEVRDGPSPDAGVHAQFSSPDDFACYLRGDMRSINDAYWKGAIAVDGDFDAVVAIAPVLDSAVFKEQLRHLHEQTDFS